MSLPEKSYVTFYTSSLIIPTEASPNVTLVKTKTNVTLVKTKTNVTLVKTKNKRDTGKDKNKRDTGKDKNKRLTVLLYKSIPFFCFQSELLRAQPCLFFLYK